jgi:hypothetical protein
LAFCAADFAKSLKIPSARQLARPLQCCRHRRNGPVKMTIREFEMTYSSSSFAAQLGVGFMSFLVSVTCILAAVGPSHIAG